MMAEPEARRFLGDLAPQTFRNAQEEERKSAIAEGRRPLLEAVILTGRRKGWLTSDLLEWANRRAGKMEAEEWDDP